MTFQIYHGTDDTKNSLTFPVVVQQGVLFHQDNCSSNDDHTTATLTKNIEERMVSGGTLNTRKWYSQPILFTRCVCDAQKTLSFDEIAYKVSKTHTTESDNNSREWIRKEVPEYYNKFRRTISRGEWNIAKDELLMIAKDIKLAMVTYYFVHQKDSDMTRRITREDILSSISLIPLTLKNCSLFNPIAQRYLSSAQVTISWSLVPEKYISLMVEWMVDEDPAFDDVLGRLSVTDFTKIMYEQSHNSKKFKMLHGTLVRHNRHCFPLDITRVMSHSTASSSFGVVDYILKLSEDVNVGKLLEMSVVHHDLYKSVHNTYYESCRFASRDLQIAAATNITTFKWLFGIYEKDLCPPNSIERGQLEYIANRDVLNFLLLTVS